MAIILDFESGFNEREEKFFFLFHERKYLFGFWCNCLSCLQVTSRVRDPISTKNAKPQGRHLPRMRRVDGWDRMISLTSSGVIDEIDELAEFGSDDFR